MNENNIKPPTFGVESNLSESEKKFWSKSNGIVLALVDSMCGVLSINFKRISFTLNGDSVNVCFELEKDRFEDLEIIENEIMDDFWTMCEDDFTITHEISYGGFKDKYLTNRIVFAMSEEV